MSNKIELSDKEIAFIIKKREEDKAKGLLRENAYNDAVNKATVEAQNRLEAKLQDNQTVVKEYARIVKELQKINPHYAFSKRSYEAKEDVAVYKYDEDGKMIYQDEKGNTTRAVVKTLTRTLVECEIIYCGETAPKHEGYYKVKVKVDRGRFRQVTKVTLDGSGFEYNEKNRGYVKMETLHARIIEKVERDIARHKNEVFRRSLNERALSEITLQFPNSKVAITPSFRSRLNDREVIRVILPNNIEIDLTYSQQEGKPIEYRIVHIENGDLFDYGSVINALAKLTDK